MGHFTPEQPLHCPHWSLLWLTLSSRYSSVLLPVLDSYLQFTPVPIDSHQFHHLSITFKQLFCTSSLQSDILKPGFDFNCTYNLGFASELHSQLWSHSLPQSQHQSRSGLWFQHRFQAWTCLDLLIPGLDPVRFVLNHSHNNTRKRQRNMRK